LFGKKPFTIYPLATAVFKALFKNFPNYCKKNKGLSQMSEICNSPYFFDRLSFSKNEILKKLKISSMAYALIQRVDKISILFFRIVYFS